MKERETWKVLEEEREEDDVIIFYLKIKVYSPGVGVKK